jgi:hypothetical protein
MNAQEIVAVAAAVAAGLKAAQPVAEMAAGLIRDGVAMFERAQSGETISDEELARYIARSREMEAATLTSLVAAAADKS